MARVLLVLALVALPALPAAGGQSATAADQTRTLNLTAYADLLRSDIALQKAAIITHMMGFTEAEDKAFWPIYRDYDAQMTRLGEERVALVADYANAYDKISDDIADTLARKALDLERRRQEAKSKAYDRVKGALNGRLALRFLQIEHQLQQLIDLQISASLPIVAK
jgi:hypothetical protein